MQEDTQQPRLILTPDQRVRVFISSTIGELQEERRAVRTAIRNLKLHPVLFEMAARPHPPREMYKANLEQSQIYLGIFWKSYGWVAPEMTVSGIEDEYNLSAEKPRLVYIKDAPEGRDPQLEKLLRRIEEEGTVCYKTFSTTEELVELAQNDIMLLLSERFDLSVQPKPGAVTPPDYLEDLNSEIRQRGIVQRVHLISELKSSIAINKSLVVNGDPGIGKTFLVGTVGEELDGIYISLRNRTPQQVCSYLANRLALGRGQVPRNLFSEDEARATLQQELANNTSVLLIDDADQNQPVVKILTSLDYYDCKPVYITRVVDEDLYQGVAKFPVPAFDRDETDIFLGSHGVSLPPGEFENLFTASHGNPLYLFYFTQYQISPPPEGLEAYQRVLWQKLPALQKELMNLLAFSLRGLNVADFHSLVNAQQNVTSTVMETKAALDTSSPLIRQSGGSYEFFHPYFEEYVRSMAERDGIMAHYHHMLGEYALQKQWVVSAAYHLLRARDPRAEGHLPDAARGAMLQGEWFLAEEFALEWIEVAKRDGDKIEEGHARHLLAQAYQELGKGDKALNEANAAIQLFDGAGDADSKEVVEIWASTLLIESGQAEETIETLKKALERHRGKDDFMESYIQVNLSFAYMQKSLFKEGAEAAGRGLELSKKLGLEHGVETSLINLAGCLGQLGDRVKQREYAEQIVAEARRRNTPRQVAAGLNQLAIVQRLNNEYDAARKSLEEAISICQKLGNIDAELLNIGNLGNVFRDQKLEDKAEGAYTEFLIKSREHGFIRHEARALELLSRIKHDRRLYEESINLGVEALTLHKKFGEHLRIASTQNYLARSYLKLGRKQESAESREGSAKHYEAAGMLDDAANAYDQAAGLWNALEQPERAASCVAEGLRCALADSDPRRAQSILTEARADTPGRYGEFYRRTLQLYLGEESLAPMTSFVYNFSAYCKKHHDPGEKEVFKAGLDDMVEVLKKCPSANLMNALAVAVEQADDSLLDPSAFNNFVGRVTNAVEHTHHRLTPDGTRIFTIGLAWERPLVVQISCYSDEQIVHRLALTLTLMLLANKDLIESVVQEFGGNQEDGLALYLTTQGEMQEGGIEITDVDNDFPVSVSGSNIPWGEKQPPTCLIVHDSYGAVSNWATNPGNKALVALLMYFHKGVLCHCAHITMETTPHSGELARKAREFCEVVLQ
jgi:tetratricopeptide (TPR) repeat protein